MKAFSKIAGCAVLALAALACGSSDGEDQGDTTSDNANFVVGKAEGATCSYNVQCGSGLVCRPTKADGTGLECLAHAETYYPNNTKEADKQFCDELSDCEITTRVKCEANVCMSQKSQNSGS